MSQKEFWTAMLLTAIMVASGMMLAHVYGCGGDQMDVTNRDVAPTSVLGSSAAESGEGTQNNPATSPNVTSVQMDVERGRPQFNYRVGDCSAETLAIESPMEGQIVSPTQAGDVEIRVCVGKNIGSYGGTIRAWLNDLLAAEMQVRPDQTGVYAVLVRIQVPGVQEASIRFYSSTGEAAASVRFETAS